MAKKTKFKIPRIIKHKDTKDIMNGLIEMLGDRIGVEDYPSLHRMATAYDAYLTCAEVLSEKGLTMENVRGEVVKRPEANLIRENWTQFLELAKEYGLTIKAKKALKTDKAEEDSPLAEFLKELN